jgi:hypothetical protein
MAMVEVYFHLALCKILISLGLYINKLLGACMFIFVFYLSTFIPQQGVLNSTP